MHIESTCRKSVDPQYEGPLKVIERITDSVFKILYKGQPMNVTVDCLKPAYLENIPENDQTLPRSTLEGNTPQTQPAEGRTYSGPKIKSKSLSHVDY